MTMCLACKNDAVCDICQISYYVSYHNASQCLSCE